MTATPPPEASPDASAAASTRAEQAEPAPQTQRVGWLELFYDLVFVVVIAQLSGHLEGDPSRLAALATFGYFLVVWTAWFNCVALTNLTHGLREGARAWVLVSMAGVGVMAVGVAPHTHRPAVFALGYALARLALTPVWVQQRRDSGLDAHQAWLFGLVISAGWIASIWAPHGWQAVAWGLLLVAESVLSMYRPARGQRLVFNSSHMIERIGAFVLICFGEAVARLVGAVNADPVLTTWVCAALGFLLLASLFWLFYDMAFARVEHAAERRPDRLGDLLGSGQFLVVNGLICFAAGLSSAIEAAANGHHLSHAALWEMCGGVSAVMFGINSLSMDAFKVELGLFRPTGEHGRSALRESQRKQRDEWSQREEQRHQQLVEAAREAGGEAGASAVPSLASVRRHRALGQVQRVLGQAFQCFAAPLAVAILGRRWPPALVVGALALTPLWTGVSVSVFRRRQRDGKAGVGVTDAEHRAEMLRARTAMPEGSDPTDG